MLEKGFCNHILPERMTGILDTEKQKRIISTYIRHYLVLADIERQQQHLPPLNLSRYAVSASTVLPNRNR